jgi:hypothetical protein
MRDRFRPWGWIQWNPGVISQLPMLVVVPTPGPPRTALLVFVHVDVFGVDDLLLLLAAIGLRTGLP